MNTHKRRASTVSFNLTVEIVSPSLTTMTHSRNNTLRTQFLVVMVEPRAALELPLLAQHSKVQAGWSTQLSSQLSQPRLPVISRMVLALVLVFPIKLVPKTPVLHRADSALTVVSLLALAAQAQRRVLLPPSKPVSSPYCSSLLLE